MTPTNNMNPDKLRSIAQMLRQYGQDYMAAKLEDAADAWQTRETELLEALRGLLAEDNMPASMSQHSIGAVKLALDAIKKAGG